VSSHLDKVDECNQRNSFGSLNRPFGTAEEYCVGYCKTCDLSIWHPLASGGGESAQHGREPNADFLQETQASSNGILSDIHYWSVNNSHTDREYVLEYMHIFLKKLMN